MTDPEKKAVIEVLKALEAIKRALLDLIKE
jgi:hypothetical protein